MTEDPNAINLQRIADALERLAEAADAIAALMAAGPALAAAAGADPRPAPEENGWIEWRGLGYGVDRLPPGLNQETRVEYYLNSELTGQTEASNLDWARTGERWNVDRYRVHKEPK